MESEITGIILAGGKNTRMQGRDKAFLEIDGKPFVKIIIDTLKDLVSEIIVVTNNPEKYSDFKVTLVRDESLDKGPLMGICSGLKASASKYNFVVACDMPFIKKEVIKFMLDKLEACDILIFRDSEKFHTLLGIYSKACIPAMEEMLSQDSLRIKSIFPRLKSCFLSTKEIEKFDPQLLSLVNINTQEELLKLRQAEEFLRCQR